MVNIKTAQQAAGGMLKMHTKKADAKMEKRKQKRRKKKAGWFLEPVIYEHGHQTSKLETHLCS